MAMVTAIIEDGEDLIPLRDQWDRLAVETSRPFCAPAWMLAWWRHARPRGAVARTVTVVDDGRLVGIAPFWAPRGGRLSSGYEVMAARLSPPAGPLAAPQREKDVAAAMVRALTALRPRPSWLRFDDWIGTGGLGGCLVEGWPKRRPWVYSIPPEPVPSVSLGGLGYEDWIATKSSKFRQETRRLRRRLDDSGARFMSAGLDEVDRSLDAFIELHRARWEGRGGSNALVPGIREMLGEAARELVPSGRMRVFAIEVEEQVIAVNILVAAGEEVSGWNSGFDQGWSRYSPSMLLTLHAVADAAERGEARVSLGPGGMGYKLRLADGQKEITTLTLIPRGASYPLTRLRLAPYQMRWALSRQLSPDAKLRLRRLARR